MQLLTKASKTKPLCVRPSIVPTIITMSVSLANRLEKIKKAQTQDEEKVDLELQNRVIRFDLARQRWVSLTIR